MTSPNAPSRDEMFAYVEWLFYEHRLLVIELWPDAADRDKLRKLDEQMTPLQDDCLSAPYGTAAKHFHFPADRSWTDVPKPSTRCRAVLDAVGLNDSNLDYQASLSRRPAAIRMGRTVSEQTATILLPN